MLDSDEKIPEKCGSWKWSIRFWAYHDDWHVYAECYHLAAVDVIIPKIFAYHNEEKETLQAPFITKTARWIQVEFLKTWQSLAVFH